MNSKHFFLICLTSCFIFTSCEQTETPLTDQEVWEQLQEAFILAEEGDTIRIPEGEFFFERMLSLDLPSNVVVTGAGIDKTIINFSNQIEGAAGMMIKGNNLVLSNFTLQDLSGDGAKVRDSENVTLKDIKVEWTAGAHPDNGAYALYPVNISGLLIENCIVSGASDAGLYIGQSVNVIVRNNLTYENVQGIAIENCSNVKVYNNHTYNNTVGISFYNLPDIPVKRGKGVEIFDNLIENNNHENFGAEGAIVSIVPAGTGFFILSGEQVTFHNNTVSGHKTASISIISYPLTGRPLQDPEFNPYSENIYVYDNMIEQADDLEMPDMSRELGQLIYALFEDGIPEILYDGIINPEWLTTHSTEFNPGRICIGDNFGADFANFDAPGNFQNISFDRTAYDCQLDLQIELEL